MHFDFLYGQQDEIPRYRSPNSPPINPTRVLEFGEPDLALVKRFDEATSKHLEYKSGQWCLLYQDGLAQVWGLKSKYDNLESVDYIPKKLRIRSDSMPQGIVSWPALPNPASTELPRQLTKKIDLAQIEQ